LEPYVDRAALEKIRELQARIMALKATESKSVPKPQKKEGTNDGS
jgi:hypothetical protein